MRRISAVAVGQPLREEHVTRRRRRRWPRVADRLEAAAREEKRTRNQPIAEGHPQDFFPTSPMIGFANPVAPPVEVWAVEGENGAREVRGRVTFGYPYEGPPTCVHGGVIAELFDELLGMSNILAGQGAMTGTLKIRYRRPTPLLAPLELVARHTGKEGRKVFAWGGIYYQGELTAEAEGIFIEVPPRPHARHRVGQRPQHRGAARVDPTWQRIDGGQPRQTAARRRSWQMNAHPRASASVPWLARRYGRRRRIPRSAPRHQAGTKLRRTCRRGLSTFRSTRTRDCQVPRATRPPRRGNVRDGLTSAGST